MTFVASHAGLGGSERYLEVLLATLDRAWIGGIVALEDGPLVDRLRSRGLDVEVIRTSPRLGILPAALKLRGLLARHSARVVHANGIKAALVAGIATADTQANMIWVKHDFSWDGPLARLVAWRAQQVVPVSAAVGARLGRRFARRVHVVPAGVETPSVDATEGRARLVDLVGCAPNDPIVTLIGRLQENKGQLELLEIVPQILERRPDARFCLVGDRYPHQPAYADVVKRRWKQLRLAGAVTLVGHRSDALALISGSDVLVVPSIPDSRGRPREGAPLVVIEALLLGTPVVGYAHGGIPDAAGDAGYLVAPGDRAGLRDAILEVLERADLRTSMVARGREHARRNTSEAMAGSLMERYREAAGR